MKIPTKWLEIIKKGNSSVKIYRAANKGYEDYKVVFYDGEGKRRFKTFANYADARAKANDVNASVASGDIGALTLSNQDRTIYLRAIESLRPTGIALDTATMEYAEAKKILGVLSLKEAAAHYTKTHHSIQRKTVPEVVAELINEKEKRKRNMYVCL